MRGICCLRPGVAGLSERIRVRSIIGRFLEHSRIYRFENGGQPEWLIGSADLMPRNLDRRVEAVVPVQDLEAQARIDEIIGTMLADDRRSWRLPAEASWRRTEDIQGTPGTLDTFEVMKRAAIAGVALATEPRRPGAGVGSLDPRA